MSTGSAAISTSVGPEVVCVGMSTVDVWVRGFSRTPAAGGVEFVETIGSGGGGDALNQAVTLARLGHATGLLSLVGTDSAGGLIRQLVAAAGVDVTGLASDPDLATSMAVALIDSDGERSFLAHRQGTVHKMGARHFPVERLRPGLKVLSVGSLMHSSDLDTYALPALLARAHELGAITVADMVADREEATLDDIAPVLSRLDYLVPSLAEVEHYTGTSDVETAAAVLIGHGVGTVVIKQGAAGATAFRSDDRWHVDSYDVPVRDTTGSGDNFVAGFVSGLASGLPIELCLQRGAATAALSVQHIGASGGVPSLAAVEEQIARGRLRVAAGN